MPDFTGQLGTSLSQPGRIQLAHVATPDVEPEPTPTRPRWELTHTTSRWSRQPGDRWPLTPTTTRWPLDD